MVFLYHERQEAALCGQHCLNNLLQGPHFTTGDLAGIAHEFDAQERQLMTEAGVTDATFLSQESGNVDASGNFSIQVLSAALSRLTGLELEDSRRPENKNAMQRPDSQKGFVLNRHSHWYCLRKLDNQWWSCNSMATAPEKITSSGNFSGLATTLRDLTYDNWTVFMVKGDTWPPPAPRNTGAPASHWVDPANPPPDPNGSAYGYDGGGSGGGGPVRKEEPKFQAFTGSGQTLGGGSSASGTSVAGGGGSEDEQLAMALSLSAGLAVKARLEARLPAEPEKGAAAARVAIRMPSGERATRSFSADDPLSALVDYVCVLLASNGATSNTNKWQLSSQYPPVKLRFTPAAEALDGADLAQTFSTAGLTPSAQLHCSAA